MFGEGVCGGGAGTHSEETLCGGVACLEVKGQKMGNVSHSIRIPLPLSYSSGSQQEMSIPAGAMEQCMEIFLVVRTGGLLASNGWRPEMLLSIPQCTGQSLIRVFPAPNVNSAQADKPWCIFRGAVCGVWCVYVYVHACEWGGAGLNFL